MKNFYPIVVDLSNKNVVVFGGGNIATRKISNLLNSGANITCISPEVSDNLECFFYDNKIDWIKDIYFDKYLTADTFLVIAATNSTSVNNQIYERSKTLNILHNIVDSPGKCSFIVPSVIAKGDLQISITTNGKAPTVSRKLKQDLKNYLEIYDPYLEVISVVRRYIKKSITDISLRRKLNTTFMDDKWVELCYENKIYAQQKMLEIVDSVENAKHMQII